jgi:hypothetical protein
MLRSLVLALSLVLCCWVAGASTAKAEPVLAPYYAIKLAPDVLAAPFVPSAVPTPAEEALQRDLRQARGLLMVGSGVLAAAAIHMALFGGSTLCYGAEDPDIHYKAPPIAASVAAGIGIGLLVWGGIKLLRAPSEYRHSHGPRAGLVFGAMASVAVTSLLLFATTVPEIIHCD